MNGLDKTVGQLLAERDLLAVALRWIADYRLHNPEVEYPDDDMAEIACEALANLGRAENEAT